MTSTASPRKNENPQLLSLPSVDDSSWADPSGGRSKDLARLRQYLEDSRPVWWRREPFRGEFHENAPKWHVFSGRTRSENPDHKWDFVWHALCDYQMVRAEIIFGPVDFNVTPPKKATRCKRCDAALKDIKKRASAASQKAAAPVAPD